MTPLAAALLLVAAAQAPAPPADLPPDQRAAALAGVTFATACLQRLGVASSAADYAKGSDDLGVQLARDYPAEHAAFQLDGDGGLGCRVRYTGPYAERMWKTFTDVATTMNGAPEGGGCVVGEHGDLRLRAVCTDTAPKPPRRAELSLERSSAAATATVTAALRLPAP